MQLEDSKMTNIRIKKEECMARRRNATLTNNKFNLPWNMSLSPVKKINCNHSWCVNINTLTSTKIL